MTRRQVLRTLYRIEDELADSGFDIAHLISTGNAGPLSQTISNARAILAQLTQNLVNDIVDSAPDWQQEGF